MKPILFPANATTFTTNGVGRLEPTQCTVVEERNGQYELSCVVPVESPHFSDITNNMILAVSPSDGATIQAFRIYQITEPLNGLVALSARHISYDLSYNTVMPFTAGSCVAAMTGLSTYSVETQPFTFWTDKTVVANFAVKVPQAVRACLGGQQGSILDVYGGVYEWDNWTVKLWTRRGSDNGVTLRYGKNITDLSQEENLESVVTGIVPFWANETQVVTLPEKSVDSTYASSYPYKRTVPVDFSSEWEDAPTETQLRNRAQTYITANNIGVPKVSIKVSFVALWQTEEYKTIAPLERVKLCDTVHIVFERYGIDAEAEVVRTEWDCLNERYKSIELGEARANLASTLVSMNDQTRQAIQDTTSELQYAIERATNAITGQNGGWIKINSNSEGEPFEILVMDNADVTQATKLWRWNLGGLGYSSNGYAGPYGTAITMDGEIVANYVTAGEMSANRVRAGQLVSTAKQPGTTVPVTTFDLDTGKLSTVDGEFKGSITGTSISGGTVSGATITSTDSGNTKSTTIQGGTITTNDLQATAGTFKGTVSAGTVTGSAISGGTISGTSISGGTISGGAISGGTINGTSITGGTVSGASISGGTVTSGTTSGSKLELSNGEIVGYYGNSQKGKINMVSGGIRLGESGSVFDSYIDVLDENGISIGAGTVQINGVTAYSGTFKDKDNHTVTVIKGIITDVF